MEQCCRHTERCLVPERHVAAAEAVGQGPPHAHEAGAGGVPCMRVAGIEHLLFLEVLPACTRIHGSYIYMYMCVCVCVCV